jgi:hypothetical protein
MGIMQELRAILLRAGVKQEDLEGSEEILKEGKQFAGNPKNYADLDSPDGKAWAKAKDLVKRHLDMDLPGDPKPKGDTPEAPAKTEKVDPMKEKNVQRGKSKLDRDLQDRQSGEGTHAETEADRKAREKREKDIDSWTGK